MTGRSEAQAIFESYLNRELTLDAAVDSYVEVLKEYKASRGGKADLSLKKPHDWNPDAADLRRADALFEELDRRLARQ